MSERTPILDEMLTEPLYAQLYRYFRDEIQTGRLAAKSKLPSVRHLSRSAGVSKMTVETAYQQLLAEGYIESRARSGFYVMEIEEFVSLPERIKEGATGRITIPVVSNSPMPTSMPTSMPASFSTCNTSSVTNEALTAHHSSTSHPAQSPQPIRYNFHNTRIDLGSFPFSTWRKCTMEALERYPDDFSFYSDKQGEPELRVEIAKYLIQARTVNCAPEQIVLGSGLLNSISLLCLLIKPFLKKVAIEEPGYVDARRVFEQHGFEVVPIALEEDGINVQTLHQSGAGLVYVTPSHQYPHGMVMPINKRLQLLEWARTTGGLIFENDYDGEFRYNAKPTPSLQGLDPHDRVIFAGDFTKSLSPALRMHYMVLPSQLLQIFHQEFAMYNCPVSRLQQRTMQLFMQNGYFSKHIRKMRHLYAKKQAALLRAVSEHFQNRVSVMAQTAGLHIVLEIHTDRTEQELTLLAANAGVKVYPIAKNWIHRDESTRPRFILGFGGLTVEEIQEGVSQLRGAWFPD